MLCDHLEGWDREGGREMQEGGDLGIYVYVGLIHFVIKQKLTHHCKTIILQQRCLKKRLTRSEIEKQIPYANTYIWKLKQKNCSEEPRGRTGIKTQT